MRLKDKVAIITGGSRGIGYATADKFLKEGATVILTASSQGSSDKAVAQLKEKYPDATVAGISPNLSNLESVRNAFREAASKYGCIDILVNNAGVSESTPFTEYTEETFDKVMDLNVKGVFNLFFVSAFVVEHCKETASCADKETRYVVLILTLSTPGPNIFANCTVTSLVSFDASHSLIPSSAIFMVVVAANTRGIVFRNNSRSRKSDKIRLFFILK